MKRMFLIIIFIFCFNNNLFTQTIPEPPFVGLKKYLDFNPSYILYTWSSIKIWGWSRDSKIAYSDEREIDGRGGIITTVAILDLINDVILWENSIDTYDYDEDYEESKENIEYKEAYNNFIINFRNKCEQTGIEFVQTDFLKLPIRHNNQTVNIIVETSEKSADDFDDEWGLELWGKIGGYKIIANNQGKTKIIHENTFEYAIMDVVVCGYFISPFEDRALVVIGECVRTFEGYEILYTFIGCHLSNGFR